MRDREQIFNDYLVEVKKASKNKEQKSSKSKEDTVSWHYVNCMLCSYKVFSLD